MKHRLIYIVPLLLALFLPVYNYIADFYGIFGVRSEWAGVMPNERFIKYEAVIEKSSETESLIFGSSRVANIPFQQYLGNSAYNFSYSQGMPLDHLQILHVLVKKLPKLKTVYLGIDETSYRVDPSLHKSDYLRGQHPEVDGISHWRFYSRYLFRQLSNIDHQYHFGAFSKLPRAVYEVTTSGRTICDDCERNIISDPDKHRDALVFKFPYNPLDFYGMDKLIADLVQIKALLAQHNIRLVLFTQPTFMNNLKWQNFPMLELLKVELAQVSTFYDFLVYDNRLTDAVNFYEAIHYRPHIGADMMDVLTGKHVAELGAFGYVVDSDNIEVHQAKVRSNLVSSIVPTDKYHHDRDYGLWQQENAHNKSPLDDITAESLLKEDSQTVVCHYNRLNRKLAKNAKVELLLDRLNVMEIRGWAAEDLSQYNGYLVIKARDLLTPSLAYDIAVGLSRHDVAELMGKEKLHSGFMSTVDISMLQRGNYTLYIIFEKEGQWAKCGNNMNLSIL